MSSKVSHIHPKPHHLFVPKSFKVQLISEPHCHRAGRVPDVRRGDSAAASLKYFIYHQSDTWRISQ